MSEYTDLEMNVRMSKRKARKDAREYITGGVLVCRGYSVRYLDDNGEPEVLADYDEMPTEGELVADIARAPEGSKVYIEGGFDYADSFEAHDDGDYEPAVEYWEEDIT